MFAVFDAETVIVFQQKPTRKSRLAVSFLCSPINFFLLISSQFETVFVQSDKFDFLNYDLEMFQNELGVELSSLVNFAFKKIMLLKNLMKFIQRKNNLHLKLHNRPFVLSSVAMNQLSLTVKILEDLHKKTGIDFVPNVFSIAALYRAKSFLWNNNHGVMPKLNVS